MRRSKKNYRTQLENFFEKLERSEIYERGEKGFLDGKTDLLSLLIVAR